MRRFFISSEQAAEAKKHGTVSLSGGDVNHIVNVLRMKPGEKLIFASSDGTEFVSELKECSGSGVTAAVIRAEENLTEPDVGVTVIQGLPKGDKTDLIIQKCVELGAVSFMPVLTQRSVSRPDGADRDRKCARWSKIAAEAAKQCGRGIVPGVCGISELRDALKSLPEGGRKWIAYENERDISLRKLLEEGGPDDRSAIYLLIGPEGGFEGGEIEIAKENGFVPFSLGKRILRTETAALAAIAGIRFYYGD